LLGALHPNRATQFHPDPLDLNRPPDRIEPLYI
jgi:hypothetical protein